MPDSDPIQLAQTWSIGPLTVDVELQGETGPLLTQEHMERRFGCFVVDGDTSPATLPRLKLSMNPDWGPWPRRGGPIPILQVEALAGRGEGFRVERSDLLARLRPDLLSLEGCMAPQETTLEECLRLLMWLAFTGESCQGLIHSACAVKDGQAYCFPAPGGTGKSTLIALTPGDQPLNDEITLLTRHPEGWRAWPSPFWNWERQLPAETIATRSWPLVAVGLLVQAPSSRFVPVSADQGLVLLMEQVVAFRGFDDAAGKTFELAVELSQALREDRRIGRLYLRKGDDPYLAITSGWT